MTINFELKMKEISKFDIYSNNRLDIKKVGNFYGRETSDVKFLDDNTISFSSSSIYFDDIFKALTLEHSNSVLRVKCVSDEEFFTSPYAFYKNGKYFTCFVENCIFLKVPKSFKHTYNGELIDNNGNYYYDQKAMDFLIKYQNEVEDDDTVFINSFGHETILSNSKCKFHKIKNCDILDIKNKADGDNIASFDMHLESEEVSKNDFLLLFDNSNEWIINDLKERMENDNNEKVKAYSFMASDDYSKINYDAVKKQNDLNRSQKNKFIKNKDEEHPIIGVQNSDDILPFY